MIIFKFFHERKVFFNKKNKISNVKALLIAFRATGLPMEQIKIRKSGQRLCIYNYPDEPCWELYLPWNDGLDGTLLRQSRVMLISKETGKILYDGGANDEG